MKPEDVGYWTELDRDYAKDLKLVKDGESLVNFIKKWDYWVDKETKTFKSQDWKWLKPLIDDCRNEKIIPTEKHDPAIALLMPKRIVGISIKANYFKVPWGTMYIRLNPKKGG